jgi:hypothetical protein
MTTFPPPPGLSAQYLGFEPCCGGNIIYFSYNSTTVIPSLGINIYNGPPAIGYDPLTNGYVPLTNQCYRIFRGTTTNPDSTIDASNYGNLQAVPTNFGGNYTWDSTTTYETPCGDETANFCPDCITQCYTLYSCDGTIPPITTDADLSAYVGTSVLIQVDADGEFDCYMVTLAPDCLNAVDIIGVDADIPCTCDCECYEIIGSAKLNYVDCDGNPVSTFVNGYWKDCSRVYPFTNPAPGPNLSITNHGDCVDGLCPSQCFELIDCDGILDPIYSTAQSLSPYAILGQVVQIQGYDNCWIVNNVVDCDCAIDVVVLQAYDTCEECNPAPNYLLTNCDDLGTIIYTSSDLSEFVGEVVNFETDCPGCWIVEEYPNPIPSDVPVIVDQSFLDCEACKTTYYVLTDCTDTEADIITSTDLSAYVGQTIILEWCPTTCWTVAVSQTSTGSGILGDISDEFDTCEECLTSFPCVCSRLKNHDTVSHNYDYLDCEGNVQTITLLSGQRSDRICMAHWLTSYPTDYVEYFGNCTLVGDVHTCPPPVYPRRSLKPGYNTPYCSTWKYEEISCKAAEALYKQVLELRYGISNCCPEEDQQYIIKKQLIDLKALVNPDYECATPSCGCNTGCNCGGSCGGGSGCGCSSGTCHS